MMLFVVDFMTMMTMALVIYPNGFKICLKKVSVFLLPKKTFQSQVPVNIWSCLGIHPRG